MFAFSCCLLVGFINAAPHDSENTNDQKANETIAAVQEIVTNASEVDNNITEEVSQQQVMRYKVCLKQKFHFIYHLEHSPNL